MKKSLLSLASCLYGFVAMAQSEASWMRYPSISPDGKEIAFTYKGDLYKVSSEGGQAVQLTFHEAHDYMPVWSKDGSQIAFASDRYGNFDVFIMASKGGQAKRLTYHSGNEYPYSFSANNQQILFGGLRQDDVAHRQYPTGSQPELYTVPINGGRVGQLFTLPAELAQSNKDGSLILYQDKKGGENEWRKHHQSSIARDIWLYDKKQNTHTQLTSFYGENRNPVFSPTGDEMYYLSEEKGNFNVFKMPLKAKASSTQLTQFKTFPVRFLSIATQTGKLSFGYDGQIYTMTPGSAPNKLNIQILTQEKSNSDAYISINGGVREMSISPDGKEIAFIARGEVFVTSVDGKYTKRITNSPQQERFVSFAPDGKSLIYSSERNGKWRVYQTHKIRIEEPYFFASTVLKETELISNDKDNYLAQYSPDGKKIAFVEDRRSIKVMDLATKKTQTLLSPQELFHMQDGDQYFTWSPDSKWLLANYRPTMSNGEVVLLDASGAKPMVNLTQSGYSDGSAKWVNDGKQMIWFSNRDGLKSHANSGSSQRDVYSMFFTKEAWERFKLNKDDYALLKEVESAEKKAKEEEAKKTPGSKPATEKKDSTIIFDWNGIEQRKARLTIHSSNLGDALLSKDGEKLYYLASFEKGANLWSTNLRTQETKMEIPLEASGGSLRWDKAQKFMYLLSGGRITKITPESNKREMISIEGEMTLDSDAERAEMFEHVWLRNQAMFYTPDMHGIDWKALKPAYQKYVPHIGNSYEFAEMLSEMLGELNVSHSGARYSRSIPDADATASLGIFQNYKHTGNGILIDEIIEGGPLDKSNLKVKAGMIIEKIDGQIIDANTDIARFLNRKADKFTLLEVVDPKTKERMEITIKPISIGAENQLLYRRWVKLNAEEVKKQSGGKLGYVHIPGMSDGPYRSVYEEMMGKYANSEAVIVDTRFNSGGDLVADLAMFFTGEKFLEYATALRSVGSEPTFRWTKPTLALFNEANYSDGHCFSSGYTDLGIGKTVGMPVPGTCSFAGWETLPDGTTWGSVPISAKNKAGQWLENNETKPTFQVKNMPGIIDQGRDQQLETAIKELMKDIK